MIRLFTALCKSYLKELSEKQKFIEATGGFAHLREICPKCGAIGQLSEYGDYDRGLTTYEDGKIVDGSVNALRFLCSSCESTHALLPDVIVPYSPYSLLFMLVALIAYYERAMTVEKICEHFGIAVSTIYDWKDRIALHKDLMLGMLIGGKKRAYSFILGLLGSGNLSGLLLQFFRKYGFSFMQNRSESASRSRPP